MSDITANVHLATRRPSEQSHWYVVRTHAGEERRAEMNLQHSEVHTFLPRVRARRRAADGSAWSPLFPQYLFARFDPERALRHVSFARGVQSVVKVGGALATVDHDVIAMLQSRVDDEGFVRIGEPLQPGDSIRIASGPFAALAGVVERNRSAHDRVLVLLTVVNGGMRVEVPRDCVQRIDEQPLAAGRTPAAR
jgi:transcriptional antiterminator RfaH